MAIQLWDLAMAEELRRPSPYCWRAKMALWHKELPFETIPVRFTEKDRLAFSGQGAVPVLVDGDRVVTNSWDIALYLEERYPDRPTLFGDATSRALASFVTDWADLSLSSVLFPLISVDVWRHVHAMDKDYYRRTREERLGTTLEQAAAGHEERGEALRRDFLAPLRATLGAQAFLSGERPLYADYAVWGTLQWMRSVSRLPLLVPDDPIAAWHERLTALHGGPARAFLTYRT
jgi:glutathione S-transferase